MSFKRCVAKIDSTLLLGASFFAFAVAFPPFTDASAVDPSFHMVEHILLVVSGAVVAYSLARKGIIPQLNGRLAAGAGLLLITLILAFWHLPGPWDAAVLNPVAHLSEHISFFGAGLMMAICLPGISDVGKVLVLVLGVFAHTAYAVVLTSGEQVYQVYTLPQQGLFGEFVFAMDPIFLGLIILVFWRADSPHGTGPTVWWKAAKLQRTASILVTTSFTFLVLGFYVTSAVAISVSSSPPGARTIVTLEETPVSWQYSPQNLTVVIGVNNTVTWVSHSLSYDTVTSQGGSFTSGQLFPGGSFTHTFTSPGVFDYHCIYHPWMVGSVTVLPAK